MSYFHLRPVCLYHVFLHYLVHRVLFGKMFVNIKGVFLFYLQLLSEMFIILRGIKRDVVISGLRSFCKVGLPFLYNKTKQMH